MKKSEPIGTLFHMILLSRMGRKFVQSFCHLIFTTDASLLSCIMYHEFLKSSIENRRIVDGCDVLDDTAILKADHVRNERTK